MGIVRTEPINYKIFEEKDLKKLADYFVKVCEELKDDRSTLIFRVYYEDGTSVSNNEPILFNETKLIESVRYNLSNFSKGVDLTLSLRKTGGSFSIEGITDDWVDAKYMQLNEIIKALKKQNKWLAEMKSQIIIGHLAVMPLVLFVNYFYLVPVIDELPINMFFTIALQLLLAFPLSSRLDKMYTNIEFDTALEHINKYKQRKNTIKIFFASYLFPILITIIF